MSVRGNNPNAHYVANTPLRVGQKSLEGFYQESGRAGRDGKDADCILYFRAQDASRLAALTAGEKEAKSKRTYRHS